MTDRIEWREEAAEHIRTRSARYPGAVDIEPSWTEEVLDDPDRTVDEPDPKSAHVNSVRVIGYSVVALRGADRGPTQIPGEGMTEITDEDLRAYRDEVERTKDDAYPREHEPGRPGQARAKVLSVRLSPGEFEQLARYADDVEASVSAVVRGWILARLSGEPASSPTATVDRIAHDVEQLRHQLRNAS